MDAFLILAFLCNYCFYVLICVDSLIHEGGMITKLYWGIIFIVWTVLNLIWFGLFMYYKDKDCTTGNYMIATVSQTFISSVVLVPLAFIKTVTEERFKDYLQIYVLTATAPIMLSVQLLYQLMCGTSNRERLDLKGL